jgi:hypothetical protein
MADRDFVVLPRDALLELFGELALPPWIDADGSVLGGGIDCAPIAQRITAWIAEHDLSDVHIGAPAVAGSATPDE